MTKFDAHDRIIVGAGYTVGGYSSKRGGDNMTEAALVGLIVAILGLLVDVISLCYTIFSNKK